MKKTGVLGRFLTYRAYRRGWADGYKRGLADAKELGAEIIRVYQGGEGSSPGRYEE